MSSARWWREVKAALELVEWLQANRGDLVLALEAAVNVNGPELRRGLTRRLDAIEGR